MWPRKKRIVPIYTVIAERMQYLYELNTPLRQRVVNSTPNTTTNWIRQIIKDKQVVQATRYFEQDAFLQHLLEEFELLYDLQFFWPIEPVKS